MFRHRSRGMVFRRKCNRRRRDGLPSAVSELDPPIAFPGGGRAGFASGVCQLNSGNAALRADEAHDTGQRLDMRIRPEAEIFGTDAPYGGDRCRLGEDKSGATDGAASQMNEVPVVGQSVNAGVFAHGRDSNAVGQRDATQCKRFEQESQREVLSGGTGSLLMRGEACEVRVPRGAAYLMNWRFSNPSWSEQNCSRGT